MTEEDEIDILGDYSLDGFLTGSNEMTNMNSELDMLQCDYSMNSQWLLDSSSSCFYNDVSSRSNERIKSVSPPTVINVIATRPNVSKIEPMLGWSTTEIVLLERGLELFGSSAVCLSQFIGSKSPNQVKQFLKIMHNKNNANVSNSGLNLDISSNKDNSDLLNSKNMGSIGDEVLDDVDIPATVEEVISIVSSNKTEELSPQKHVKFKKMPNNTNKTKHCNKNNSSRSVLKPIFRKHLNKPSNLSVIKANKISIKESIIASMRQKLSKTKSSKQKELWVNRKAKLQKININRNKSKLNDSHYKLHLITGGGKALPISETEEVIKLKNKSEQDDTDSDIEIEVDDLPEKNNTVSILNSSNISEIKIDGNEKYSDVLFNEETMIDDINSIDCFHEEVVVTDEISEISETDKEDSFDDKSISVDLKNQLLSKEFPKTELVIENHSISELEKYFNSEFFDGRPTKTPDRYLKIRNHMLSRWNDIRPHYLSKTQARQGLKNCGDVNSIGRIHSILEQMAAINFNCEQTSYIRPMIDMFKVNTSVTSNSKSDIAEFFKVRARKKNKVYATDCEGYTISHGQNVEKAKTALKLRTHYKRNGGQLISCMKYTENFKQPFEVHIELSALICMYFHSITSRNEIMGLAGGTFYKNKENNLLHIYRYQPCQTVQQTRIDCEMCPVSQSESVTAISNEGLTVVGWVHSHPGFPPLPSLQDLHTQKEMQSCFEKNGPFMGIIIGPHTSELRCLTIPNFSNGTPYEFGAQYKHDSNTIKNLQAGLKNILEVVKSYSSDILKPNEKSPYNANMRAIDKLLSDLKLIFNKLSPRLMHNDEEQIINLILSLSNEIDAQIMPT